MDSNELKAGRSRAQRAKEKAGERGARSGRSSNERDGDPVETVAGAEDTREPVLGAEDEQGACHSRDGAGEGHRLDHAPAGPAPARPRRLGPPPRRSPTPLARASPAPAPVAPLPKPRKARVRRNQPPQAIASESGRPRSRRLPRNGRKRCAAS